jgi:hypothetical protein
MDPPPCGSKPSGDGLKLEERRRVSASADSAEEINDTTGIIPWSFIMAVRI